MDYRGLSKDDHGLSRLLWVDYVSWIIVDYRGLSWIMNYRGVLQIIMDYHGLSQMIMDYHGLSWTTKYAPP